jgi:hypothetical protein
MSLTDPEKVRETGTNKLIERDTKKIELCRYIFNYKNKMKASSDFIKELIPTVTDFIKNDQDIILRQK